MKDAEILSALARNVSAIRDDANKAALLMHLFGRRWHEALERLRDLATAPEGDRVEVVHLTIARIVKAEA